jgi:membrane protease YdiL (CAAX protease family)
VGSLRTDFAWWLAAKLLVWLLPAFLIARARGQRDLLPWLGFQPGQSLFAGYAVCWIWLAGQWMLAALRLTPRPQPHFDLSVFSACVLSPLLEEAVFRGFALGWLVDVGWRQVPAVLTSTAMFGGLHLVGWTARGELWSRARGDLPFILLLGALAALLRLWTRSLWPSIVLHAVNNAGAQGAIVAVLRALGLGLW